MTAGLRRLNNGERGLWCISGHKQSQKTTYTSTMRLNVIAATMQEAMTKTALKYDGEFVFVNISYKGVIDE